MRPSRRCRIGPRLLAHCCEYPARGTQTWTQLAGTPSAKPCSSPLSSPAFPTLAPNCWPAAAAPQAVATFCAITDAAPHVAEHVLDAHHWELDTAVNFYLESGGVGHGVGHAEPPVAGPGPPAAAGGWEEVQDLVAEEGEAPPARPAAGRTAAASAAVRPRSEPIEASAAHTPAKQGRHAPAACVASLP